MSGTYRFRTELHAWKAAVRARLALYRLCSHEGKAQVVPVRCAVPWLGFVIYSGYCRLESRKVGHTTRRLRHTYRRCQRAQCPLSALSRRMRAWVGHVRHVDGDGVWRVRRTWYAVTRRQLNAVRP